MLNKTLQGHIKVIQCFPKGSQFYWIEALNTCDSNKGFLVLYFNLL